MGGILIRLTTTRPRLQIAKLKKKTALDVSAKTKKIERYCKTQYPENYACGLSPAKWVSQCCRGWVEGPPQEILHVHL